jgi:hypothetical protein
VQRRKIIEQTIKELFPDLSTAPKFGPGKPGIKTFVHEKLAEHPLFVTVKMFRDAWESVPSELRTAGGLSPPKI